MEDFLAIYDNFERARADYQALSGEQKESLKPVIAGFELIYKSMQEFLKNHGVELVEAAGKFDPSKHEALAQVDAAGAESGAIVSVVAPGFSFKGKLLRPARVTVAR